MTDQHKKPHKDPLVEALEKAKKGNTSEEIEKLKKELEETNKKLAETEEKLSQVIELGRRAVADMENMKRRAEEDRSRMALFANIDLIKQILPALDNFNRAIHHLPKDLNESQQEWVKGVSKTFDQIKEALTKTGVIEIGEIGEPFNPEVHEAVLQGPGPKDQIIEVLDKGYKLGQYTIRAAKVKVGQG